MSRVTQSISQLLTSFGPGAMMDLPTRSVVVAGLDHWDTRKTTFKTIEEPRLTALLQAQLVASGRWEAGKPMRLLTPPIAQEARDDPDPAGVTVRIFPTWFTCDGFTDTDPNVKNRRRRLVRWTDLEAAGGRKRFQREDGKKVDVTPIRFVAACKLGHLQDIDWKWLVHRGDKCSESMWIEEAGTSADPANIRIGCLCGRLPVSLADAFKPGFLGKCKGHRPWLDTHEEACDEHLHFLSRSATNTFFAQTVTVISLPIGENELDRAIRKYWTSLQAATDPNVVAALRNVPEIGAALEGFSNEEVYQRIGRLKEADIQVASQNPKIAEFDLLTSGAQYIGKDDIKEPLYAETLQTVALDKCQTRNGTPFLESVVAVHRLKEVTCLYGFTRLEPAVTASEALIEDVRLAVDGAPLSEDADWLPAMEQLGEGLFLKVSSQALRDWLTSEGSSKRGSTLRSAFQQYHARYHLNDLYPGLPYIVLHSLSHALMAEIALECGYPLSSLKERVYAFSGIVEGIPDRYGLLIYTASAGAQGTLGGLISIARDMPRLISSALNRMSLCSNDPVCADHNPTVHGDERALHGAACHSCLLVPETSCEARNLFLDRAVLVDTVAESRSALFAA